MEVRRVGHELLFARMTENFRSRSLAFLIIFVLVFAATLAYLHYIGPGHRNGGPWPITIHEPMAATSAGITAAFFGVFIAGWLAWKINW